MSVFTLEAGLALLGLALLMVEAFKPDISRRTLGFTAMAGTALALVLLPFCGTTQPGFMEAWHQLDTLAVFYKGFALVVTLLVLWLTLECAPYLTRFTLDGKLTEMFSLPLIACAGMMWMASARDLVTVFVSLELVTVSFYVLVAFARKSAFSLEAGVKYLILGALSTGVLVYGIAWIYGATGSMNFAAIGEALADPITGKPAALFGAALLLCGLGFKVAAAPFHMWVPDVYQGAPTPVTAFLSVGSKAAGFIVLTRAVDAFLVEGSIIGSEIQALLLVAGSLTALLGSLPAMFQTSVKRLLAYSSISHAGYLLLALACRETARFDLSSGGVVAFYLATYLPMTVLGFLGLGLMRANGLGEDIKDFAGLSKRNPWLALLMTVSFASLAGLPLTAGFLGKLFVFLGLADHGYWGALSCAVIAAAAGFYYYFKTILAMYSIEGTDTPALTISTASKVVAGALAVVILVLGVYPKPLQKVLAADTPAVVAN
ncbi:MAG: NADH-quinone oxidoreductase subunit N [Prosthecobacter sp.]